jgi:GcrA cell cycle regulator
MGWTDEKIAILTKMWGEGRPASEIARVIGGVSRNAVIGKVHRLNLASNRPIDFGSRDKTRRGNIRPRVRRVKPKTVFRPKAIVKPLTPPRRDVEEPTPLLIPLLALEASSCRFPIGDKGATGYLFCGHQSWQLLPYCEYHARLAYPPRFKSEAA